jgi:hypothetical protein
MALHGMPPLVASPARLSPPGGASSSLIHAAAASPQANRIAASSPPIGAQHRCARCRAVVAPCAPQRHNVAAIAHRTHASRVVVQRRAEKTHMQMRILLTVHTCVQIA